MNFKETFDIVLMLVLVYFVLSLVSSSLSQLIMETLEIRGRTLSRYLSLIVGDNITDLINLPQIKSLRPIRFRSWLGMFGASTEPKMVENIPIPILTDSFFDLMGLADKENQTVEELKTTIDKMPESEGKRAMLLWIQQGTTNLNDLRAKLTVFFSGLLDQAAATANANARSFVITLSIFLVFLLGTDTITIVRDLWIGPQVRALVAMQAEFFVTQDCSVMDLGHLVNNLEALSPGIGWPQALRYLPQQASLVEWTQFVILKIVGLAITIVFVSQGSGFWFDLLNKLK